MYITTQSCISCPKSKLLNRWFKEMVSRYFNNPFLTPGSQDVHNISSSDPHLTPLDYVKRDDNSQKMNQLCSWIEPFESGDSDNPISRISGGCQSMRDPSTTGRCHVETSRHIYIYSHLVVFRPFVVIRASRERKPQFKNDRDHHRPVFQKSWFPFLFHLAINLQLYFSDYGFLSIPVEQ